MLRASVDAGATTLNIPDTVGYGIPWDFGDLIQHIRKEVPGDYVLSTHCHNDLGLATANTLAGVQAGARQVEVCVNGLGERAGNAALEEVVMALRIRPDQFPGVTTTVRTEELARASRLVARLTGYPVQYNKAVVGRNAFAHESGHPPARGPRRPLDLRDHRRAPASARWDAQIVMGKHSGRHAFADTLEKMGIHVQGDGLNQAFVRFKELADRKVEITEADLEAIVAEELGQDLVRGLPSRGLEVAGGTVGMPRRPCRRQPVRRQGGGLGRGRRHDRRGVHRHPDRHQRRVRLIGFNVSSVTGGVDALGDVVVQLETRASRCPVAASPPTWSRRRPGLSRRGQPVRPDPGPQRPARDSRSGRDRCADLLNPPDPLVARTRARTGTRTAGTGTKITRVPARSGGGLDLRRATAGTGAARSGISLMHSGQSRVPGSASGPSSGGRRARSIGLITKKKTAATSSTTEIRAFRTSRSEDAVVHREA